MALTGTGRISRPFPTGDTLPGFPMRRRRGQKHRALAAAGGADGKRRTAGSSSATVCTRPSRCMIPPADDISASSIPGMGDRWDHPIQRAPWSPRDDLPRCHLRPDVRADEGQPRRAAERLGEGEEDCRISAAGDGLGEYPLDVEQTRQVAKVLGFRPEPDRFYYYVEPYDPPEDTGFQQETSSAPLKR